MVLQRQVPTRAGGKSSDLGASPKAGGETGKEPFADVLSGQQRAATAKPGRAEGNRDDAPAAEAEDLDNVQTDPATKDAVSATGESDDVLALLNDLMSSAAYADESGVGVPANAGADVIAAGEVTDKALSGAPSQETTDPLTALQTGDAAARPGSDQPVSRGKEAHADGAGTRAAELRPTPTEPGTRQGSGFAQSQTASQVPDAERASATATTMAQPVAAMARPAAAMAKPAAEPLPRERAKHAEAKEVLRALGLDGQVPQGNAADTTSRVDRRETEPPARNPSATSRQPEEKLENSPRNVEVLESRRFVAAQPLGGNSQMLARSIMEAGDAALAAARAGPAQTSAVIGQQQSGQTLHTLKLQLNPVSLGSVIAVLKLSGEELQVDIKVETAEAYRQLADDNQGLLKALRSQGYGVEQINVQHVAGGDRAQNQQAGAQPGFQGPGSNDAQASDREAGDGRNGGSRSDGDNGRQTRDQNAHPASGGVGRTDGVYL